MGQNSWILPWQDQTLCTASPFFQFQQVRGGKSWQPGAENSVTSVSVATCSVKDDTWLKAGSETPRQFKLSAIEGCRWRQGCCAKGSLAGSSGSTETPSRSVTIAGKS